MRHLKKPYSRPRLVCYGHVKDLIQGATGRKNDFSGSGRSRACWIAEALYGVGDSRTLLLRQWLGDVYENRRAGWVFVALYRVFGRPTAKLIVGGRLPRRPFRRLFDALLDPALTHAIVRERKRRAIQ